MEEDNKSLEESAVKDSVEEEATQKNQNDEAKKEKMYSRAEVNKMLNAEKDKIRSEIEKDYKAKQDEATKLAKMDAEEKLNYELDLKTKENESLKNQLNSLNLKAQATTIANEKGLPLGYIEDFDYAKETAETIAEKIDKLIKVRSADLDGYLKGKLKEPSKKAVEENSTPSDPYLVGYKNYLKKYGK